jgi:16S rRNA (guanine966-N2)-methyltransferase
VFSSLGSLDGRRVLDAYAGSGALGIEALSRGAAHAVFVERARPALKALRQNLATLQLSEAGTVLGCPVERAAGKLREAGPFDVIFADPPYADLEAALVVLASWLGAPPILAGGGILVIEHAARDALSTLSGMSVRRSRRYGATCMTFLVFDAD